MKKNEKNDKRRKEFWAPGGEHEKKLLRLRSRTPEECLKLCGDEPDYGPVFGCEVCHKLFFLEDVVPSSTVPQLKEDERRREFVDVEFVASHPSLFEQLDRLHCCKKCRKTIEGGGLPAGAAINDLKCTWASHSRAKLSVGQEELECVSLSTMFSTVEGIRKGVQGRRPGLTKKMMVPTGEFKPSAWLVDYNTGMADDGVWPHVGEESGPVPVLRELVLTELFGGLLDEHGLYRGYNRDRAVESMVRMVRYVTEKETERLAGSEGQGPTSQRLDFFTARGPTVYPFLHSVLVPDNKEVDVGWLTEEEDLLTRIGAAVYDLRGEAGPTGERRVPLSRRDWIQHHLSHVHRRGLVHQPTLVMAMFLQQVAKTMRETLPAIGTLARVPGSSDRNEIVLTGSGECGEVQKVAASCVVPLDDVAGLLGPQELFKGQVDGRHVCKDKLSTNVYEREASLMLGCF